MYKITRTYTFSAAHRLEGHPKCGRLHGHNYSVVVELGVEVTDHGMVLDYGELDDYVKPIIDSYDHRYIVSRDNRDSVDPYAELALRNNHAVDLPMPASTAECLAQYLYSLIVREINMAMTETVEGVTVLSVQVNETEKSTAKYEPS